MIRQINEWRYRGRTSPMLVDVWRFFLCWCVGHSDTEQGMYYPFCDRCGHDG
jgi:hypothetical protein